MSTKDVIKSGIYENLVGGTGLTQWAVIGVLLTAAVVGVYIFFVYKLTGKAAFYSRDLNVTIAGLPVIVAAIMVAMQSNLLVSFGMVGALSIVRFRNAIKNPLDLLFLFWSVSAGIIVGVGLKLLAVALCVVMTVLVFVLQLLPASKSTDVLIVRAGSGNVDWKWLRKTLNTYAGSVKEKSRSQKGGMVELVFELRTKNEDELLAALEENEFLEQVHFMAHDGEYRI